MKPNTYVYKSVGECDIKVDVYQPDSFHNSPIIVHIHGGALINGSRINFKPHHVEMYLKAGFTVASIDYRLAPESKLSEIVEDIEDCFSWMVKKGPELFSIDPERILVVGHSAGAYLALLSGYHVKPKPRAIVSFYGYGDILGDWYMKPSPYHCQESMITEDESGRLAHGPVISEPYQNRGKENYYLYCRQQGIWTREVSGVDPLVNPEYFLEYCPLQNVNSKLPPTMLLHGVEDTDVPFEQSVLMADAFKRQGAVHEMISIPELGHHFDNRQEHPLVIDAMERVLKFLRNYS